MNTEDTGLIIDHPGGRSKYRFHHWPPGGVDTQNTGFIIDQQVDTEDTGELWFAGVSYVYVYLQVNIEDTGFFIDHQDTQNTDLIIDNLMNTDDTGLIIDNLVNTDDTGLIIDHQVNSRITGFIIDQQVNTRHIFHHHEEKNIIC